jgi:hypothetical protein
MGMAVAVSDEQRPMGGGLRRPAARAEPAAIAFPQ